ncbi:Dirigent protein [Rhynchospora pubera]|uniref:Dirigent protein n=2 Tax=Rhynchospora pubera TaxID=906938 RepID=A0AAV8DT89_9POAL|nr:Dirigent protein [Rhynchospora pubera]
MNHLTNCIFKPTQKGKRKKMEHTLLSMASSIFSSLLLLLFLSCATNFTPVTSSEQGNDYLISCRLAPHFPVEKQSHFRFYWHDILSGPNPTAVQVVQTPETIKSSTLFGAVVMIDDALTTRPDVNSKLVGRAQGLYTGAGLKKIEFLIAMNFVFTDGKYNGSTIAIFGHDEVLAPVREMPIVGGSGLFRFARGYVEARTYSVDWKTGDAVVQYDVFVNHY